VPLCPGGEQLGDGNTAPSGIPVAVDTTGVLVGRTLAQVSAGDGFACALDTSERLPAAARLACGSKVKTIHHFYEKKCGCFFVLSKGGSSLAN
jgi:hypothetical protein